MTGGPAHTVAAAGRAHPSSAAISTVSVIICTYADQRWPQLLAAVKSVAAGTRIPEQVIVVVDHNDALAARAREELTSALVVTNREKRGLSGARNTGIEVATGDVVAFLDDDAVAERSWLAALLEPLASPGVAAAGGLATPEWESGRPRWFPEEFDWVVGCSYRGMPTSAAAIRNPLGCNMAFRRDVFHAIGGFRSDLGRIGRRPLGAEETELCIRLAARMPGSLIVYVPEAEVRHAVPAARGTWAYFSERCYSEGLSKAVLGRLAGRGTSLSTEWRYVLGTLPQGVISGVASAVRRRDTAGLARAATIVAGLALTVAGFVVGSVRRSSL